MKELEGKTVLVTGAGGFIGRHLGERLSTSSNTHLLLLSRSQKRSAREDTVWLSSALEALTPDFWSFHNIKKIDYVFHLGAFIPKTSVDANCLDRAIDSNILGTRSLLQALPSSPERFVFASTVDVYAEPQDGEVLSERSPVAPTTLYGASKLFCEALVAAWSAEVGAPCAILRYGHIYGPGEERFRKFIPVVIRTALAGHQPVVLGDGSTLRDYLYVGDAVEATIRAALAQRCEYPLNIVCGRSVTLRAVAELVTRLVGREFPPILLSDKPNGISLRFDNSKMRQFLGTWPMTSLQDGLAAEVEAFRTQDSDDQRG